MTGKAKAIQPDGQAPARNGRAAATIQHLAREAVAPDLAELRERVEALEAALVDAPVEPEDRAERIARVLDAKRIADWIDSRYSRSEIEARLGTRRSTIHRWRKGQIREAKIEKVEEFLEALGGIPADLPDELAAADTGEAAAP